VGVDDDDAVAAELASPEKGKGTEALDEDNPYGWRKGNDDVVIIAPVEHQLFIKSVSPEIARPDLEAVSDAFNLFFVLVCWIALLMAWCAYIALQTGRRFRLSGVIGASSVEEVPSSWLGDVQKGYRHESGCGETVRVQGQCALVFALVCARVCARVFLRKLTITYTDQ
jgi:hypothetical protein